MRAFGAAAIALPCMISGAGTAAPDDLPFSGTFKIGDMTISVKGIIAADHTVGVAVNGVIAPDQNFSFRGIVSPDQGFSFTGTTPTGQTFSGSFGNKKDD